MLLLICHPPLCNKINVLSSHQHSRHASTTEPSFISIYTKCADWVCISVKLKVYCSIKHTLIDQESCVCTLLRYKLWAFALLVKHCSTPYWCVYAHACTHVHTQQSDTMDSDNQDCCQCCTPISSIFLSTHPPHFVHSVRGSTHARSKNTHSCTNAYIYTHTVKYTQ